jgi:hypothetical protein
MIFLAMWTMEYLRRDIHKGSVVEQGDTNAMHMPHATMKHVGTPSIYRLYRTISMLEMEGLTSSVVYGVGLVSCLKLGIF